MKPEHDERFRRIAEDYFERPGGDYAELLRRGQVSSPDGVDPEEWRAEIRAKARADKIRVITIRDGDRAIAARQRSIPKDPELAELTRELDRSVVLRGLAERARQLGHDIGRWLRHDQENIAICTRCPARIYARFDEATGVRSSSTWFPQSTATSGADSRPGRCAEREAGAPNADHDPRDGAGPTFGSATRWLGAVTRRQLRLAAGLLGVVAVSAHDARPDAYLGPLGVDARGDSGRARGTKCSGCP